MISVCFSGCRIHFKRPKTGISVWELNERTSKLKMINSLKLREPAKQSALAYIHNGVLSVLGAMQTIESNDVPVKVLIS